MYIVLNSVADWLTTNHRFCLHVRKNRNITTNIDQIFAFNYRMKKEEQASLNGWDLYETRKVG